MNVPGRLAEATFGLVEPLVTGARGRAEGFMQTAWERAEPQLRRLFWTAVYLTVATIVATNLL